MELLNHKVEYIQLFKKLPNSSVNWLYHFIFSQPMHESSNCSTSLCLVLPVFFNLVILLAMKWNIIVFLILVSLMTNHVERLFLCLRGCMYLLLQSITSSFLSVIF